MFKSFSALSAFSAVTILLLATLLRFYRIDFQSYWNDEGNSRVLASRDVPTIVRNAAADVHPPGYYLLLKFWRDAVGESEMALRGFSALAGVLLIAVVYRLGRSQFGGRAAVIAALLGAINPFLIYYSQEARMYSLLALTSAASWWLLLRIRELGIGEWKWSLGYVLVTALGLYTHYAFGFVVIAQVGMAAVVLARSITGDHQFSNSRILLYCGLFALAGLLFLPWLPTALRHLGWPAVREYAPWPEALLDLTRTLAFGRTLPLNDSWLGIAAVGMLLIVALLRFRLHPSALSLWLWLLIPCAITLALGLLTDTFAKALVVAVPPLCVLLAAAASDQPSAVSRGLVLLSFVSLVSFSSLSLNNLYFNPLYFRDDYRGIAQYIQRIEREGDAVITNSPNQVEAVAYYFRDEARLFPLPDTRPLDQARTQLQLEALATNHNRLFVLYWGDTQADPEKFIEDWLNTHTFKAGEQWFGQVRLATYAVAQSASTPTTLIEARIGDHIVLDGYTLSATTFAPGDILQITFFWRADAALTERYKVFIHLYTEVDAPPLAQMDGEPGGGLVLTTIWQPGRRVADNHGLLLPSDLPPGKYRLMAGLYNLADGTRLPITVGATIVGDRFDLGLITVVTKVE